MNRKELVAMFMESPFYFDMILEERLKMIQEYMNRFCENGYNKSINICNVTKSITKKDGSVVIKIIVGYFPPKNQLSSVQKIFR